MLKVLKFFQSPKGKIASIFLLVSSFAVASVLAKTTDPGFVDARIVAPESLIGKAVNENYHSELGTIYPKVFRLRAGKELFVFDFNTQELCGVAGCLHAVYTREGQRLLSIYLRSELPNKTTKLLAVDGTENGFPCLKTAQFDEKNNLIVATRYCVQGKTLIPVFYQLLEVTH